MTESRDNILSTIVTTITSHDPIPLAQIKAWLATGDLPILGAVLEILDNTDQRARIFPPFSVSELEEFLFPFYERCINENPVDESDWDIGRFDATMHIQGWFTSIPDTTNETQLAFLDHLVAWLRDFYLRSNDEIREVITLGALEHILENPRWRPLFDDWCLNEELAPAYEMAMDWAFWMDERRSKDRSN